MPTQLALALPPAAQKIDERRRAAWLGSAYSDTVWTVSDSRDSNKTKVIDFRYRLADGRMLPEADRLYATIKEYAWWLRDARFSRIDDAATHSAMVWNMMHLAHALSIRKLQSFAQLQPFDVEQLTEECRYGVDAVIRASDRVQVYLEQLSKENKLNPKINGGLPKYIDPRGWESNYIHASLVLKACKLPSSASKLPRVANLLGRAALDVKRPAKLPPDRRPMLTP